MDPHLVLLAVVITTDRVTVISSVFLAFRSDDNCASTKERHFRSSWSFFSKAVIVCLSCCRAVINP